MPFIIIRHRVADYAKWKRGVRAAAKWRKASGEKSFHVLRGIKNPNDLIICCRWDTEARMRKFVKSAELRKRMKEVGVISKPEVSFFGKEDDLAVR